MKAQSDPMIIAFAIGGISLVFGLERLYLQPLRQNDQQQTGEGHL
jgi:hypothetical protein